MADLAEAEVAVCSLVKHVWPVWPGWPGFSSKPVTRCQGRGGVIGIGGVEHGITEGVMQVEIPCILPVPLPALVVLVVSATVC